MVGNSSILVLIGMKHCGKTTVGKLTAEKLKIPFEDLDQVMAARYKKITGANFSVREIYRLLGKDHFDRHERESLQGLLNEYTLIPHRISLLLSLGGGTIENSTALSLLDPTSHFVYLEESEDTLLERILKTGIPAFLNEKDPQGDFHALYKYRTALYRAKADSIVQVRGRTPEDVANAVCEIVSSLETNRSNG